jgi:hypothetical protein
LSFSPAQTNLRDIAAASEIPDSHSRRALAPLATPTRQPSSFLRQFAAAPPSSEIAFLLASP